MTTRLHGLDIYDVTRSWSERRVYADADGVGEHVVFVATCDCGARFEGRDSDEVTRLFSAHVAAVVS